MQRLLNEILTINSHNFLLAFSLKVHVMKKKYVYTDTHLKGGTSRKSFTAVF